MDSEHRHELKTNELADTLAHLPELIKENANMIIGLALIAIALITWPMFTRMNQRKERAEQSEITQAIQSLNQDVRSVLNAAPDDTQARLDALNSLQTNADDLLEKASKADNPNLAAMAQIKAAQAFRTELHLRQEVDADMLESQIQKAKDAYNLALKNAQTPTLKAMAELGLGLCSEELGQTDQAGEIYKKIVNNESYKSTIAAVQAKQRLDGLKDNSETFTFAEVPMEVKKPSPENNGSAAALSPQATTPAAVEPATPETAPISAAAQKDAAGKTSEPNVVQP